MWVRSQDKNVLVEVKSPLYLTISHTVPPHINVCSFVEEGSTLEVAKYSTKEKALKVMDMLEIHIEELEYKVSGREAIFLFPKDEEVEA